MAWIEVNGKRVRYRHHPAALAQAPKLLLLHMAGSSSVAWSQVARGLGDGVDVLAPDLPGHGQSEGEPLDSVAAMASFALDFANAVGLDQFFVAGHSMGGAISLQLALDLNASQPSRLKGLALVSTGARLPVAPQIFARIDQDPEQLGVLLGGPGLKLRGPSAQVEVIFPQTTATGLRRDFAACSSFDLRDRLQQIHQATRVLVGRNDVVTPASLSEDLVRGLGQSSLHIAEGAGHLLPRERSAWVIEILRGLLD